MRAEATSPHVAGSKEEERRRWRKRVRAERFGSYCDKLETSLMSFVTSLMPSDDIQAPPNTLLP